MRKILVRLMLWLVRRLNINLIDQARLFVGPDAVERGARWESFYRERGGLADMLDAIRREAFEAAAELDPAETDKIYYWAMADRNVRKLQNRIEAVVVSGQVAASNAEQLARMNSARINRG